MKIETYNEIVHFYPSPSDGKTDDGIYDKKGCPLVRFDSYRHPFLMLERYCCNPECDCNETLLDFMEIDEEGVQIADPLRFNICLDIEIWQEKRKPERHQVSQRLVDEFINNLTNEIKGRFKAHYENEKKRARNAAKFKISIDEIDIGILVSYAEVFGDNGSILYGGRGYGFTFEHNCKKYMIDDIYCINPACQCEAVRLVFIEFCKETGVLSELFECDLSFKNRLKIEHHHPQCTKEEAKKIFKEWQKSDPEVTDVLKYRYKEMKKIGQRLVAKDDRYKTIPKYSIPSSIRRRKIGRNDPCPCGSGKKYKKCCGKL